MRGLRASALQLGFTLLSLLVATSLPVLGQTTGTIQGQVSDSSGAVIPGANVTATNEQTGVTRTAVSADDGYYRFLNLAPGSYQVRVELPGFKTVVQSNVRVTGEATVGLNLSLPVGEVTQSIEVTAEEPQVETQVARISEVIPEKEIRSLPVMGRGVLNLTMMSPGIVGKQEDRGNYCCDVFTNFGAPVISSGGNERKAQFFLDGITLRYGSGSRWGAIWSPNPDAVAELRVTTHPHSAEFGLISGPQVQIVAKGGTNEWHGTAHYLDQEDEMNARPFFSRTVPDSHYRLYGGTVGGPIIKERLFIFGAYEGLRERRADATRELVETQAFRDMVVNTRPNSIAAALLKAVPPFRYPTEGLVDRGSPLPGVLQWSRTPDGIPDLGLVTNDQPFARRGNQFNLRADYYFPNGKDRIYASFWHTFPKWSRARVRNAFSDENSDEMPSVTVSHARSFTPSTLNEARFGFNKIIFKTWGDQSFLSIPSVQIDDGFGLGTASRWLQIENIYQVTDTFSINRGRHAMKLGADFRYYTDFVEFPVYPIYNFASILDFADDEPYRETRNGLDFRTGEQRPSLIHRGGSDLAFFVQNTWQVRPNLTFNYGLRWETGRPKWLFTKNWQPVLTSAQVKDPSAIAQVANQSVKRYYDWDLNNFGPRLGMAWDPTGRGKMSVRLGFGILHDEINWYPLADMWNNPPSFASVSAGLDFKIPIVYGLAPTGTTNFPTNPNFRLPQLSAKGGIVGARANVDGIVSDLKMPQVYDFMGGVQYQLLGDLMAQINYKYRRTTTDIFAVELNRFQGDLLDGRLNGFNPEFDRIRMTTNFGRRFYHGLITNISKRFSDGSSFSGSYTYNHGKTNWGRVPGTQYYSNSTDTFNYDIDWARDDIPHVFTFHSLWELPVLRGRTDLAGRILGGWQLNTIWSLQAGGLFTPYSTAPYGRGGDFNADGIRLDRPDRPTTNLPSTFSKKEWLNRPLTPSLFPLPDPKSPRPGTLPRDMFRGPGYARIDAAFVKEFLLPVWGAEEGRLQIRAEAFNVLNRLNISSVQEVINASNFGQPTGAHLNRLIQIGVKFVF